MKASCAKYIVCIFIVQGAGESATAFRQERGSLTLNIRKITGRSESRSSEKPEEGDQCWGQWRGESSGWEHRGFGSREIRAAHRCSQLCGVRDGLRQEYCLGALGENDL